MSNKIYLIKPKYLKPLNGSSNINICLFNRLANINGVDADFFGRIKTRN